MSLTVEVTNNSVRIPLELFDPDVPLELVVQDAYVVVQPVVETKGWFSVDPRRAEMQREVAAFEQQHSELVKTHLGQYVAFHNGRMLDSDADGQALRRRVRDRFGDAVVMVKQVEQVLPSPLRLGSLRRPRS